MRAKTHRCIPNLAVDGERPDTNIGTPQNTNPQKPNKKPLQTPRPYKLGWQQPTPTGLPRTSNALQTNQQHPAKQPHYRDPTKELHKPQYSVFLTSQSRRATSLHAATIMQRCDLRSLRHGSPTPKNTHQCSPDPPTTTNKQGHKEEEKRRGLRKTARDNRHRITAPPKPV